MPVVSLLVPIYNAERYLDECLKSARAQTLRDIEIICINDGSTDGSLDIMRAHAAEDERIRVIDKPNSGYGASMNRGLAQAQGTFVGVLESDDIMEADALELLITLALEADAQVAKGDFWLYWSRPVERRERFGLVQPEWEGRVLDPRIEPAVFYAKPSIWSAVYRRDFLLEGGIDFLETPGASYQDSSFTFKVWASANRAVFTQRPVLSYRQDNEQSSVNSPGKAYCVCDEYAEMERYLALDAARQAALKGVLQRMKFDTYLWNFDRLAPELRDAFAERAAEEFSAANVAGVIDRALFEPWASAELDLLMGDPRRFAQLRESYHPESGSNTFAHYLQVGGAGLVARMALDKLRRSPR